MQGEGPMELLFAAFLLGNGHYVTRQNIPYGEILEKYKEFSSRDYDPEITIMCFDTRVSTQ